MASVDQKRSCSRLSRFEAGGDAVTAFLAFYQVFSATLLYLAEKRQFTAEKNT